MSRIHGSAVILPWGRVGYPWSMPARSRASGPTGSACDKNTPRLRTSKGIGRGPVDRMDRSA